MNSLANETPTVNVGLEQALLLSGWQQGPPPGVAAWAQQIDRKVATTSACPVCRKRVREFRPLHRGSRYIALAVCRNPECGHQEEF